MENEIKIVELAKEHVKEPYENMLRNIGPRERIYRTMARTVLEKVIANVDDELIEKIIEERNDISEPIAGDIFFLMYSQFPLLKDKVENELLEEVRKQIAEFMKTREYEILRDMTMLDTSLSLVYATRFTTEFMKALIARVDPSKWPKKGKSRKKMNKQEKQKLADAVKQAFSEAKKIARTVTEYAKIGGELAGKAPGELTFADKKLGIDIVEFHLIVKFLGKMRNAIPTMYKMYKEPNKLGYVEGYGITLKPENAIPKELALPDDIFYAKLASGGFVSREKRLPRKGVVIILLDKSGSMRGNKIAWAKAVALALALKAKRQKVDYYIIPFDYRTYDVYDKNNINKLLGVGASGGTNISRALFTALELAERNKYQYANIVVITDGADTIRNTSEIIARAKKLKATIKVFYIQGYNNELEEIANKTGGILATVEPSAKDAIRILRVS